MTLQTFTIVPANEEQTLESRRRSFVSWGRGLTLEDYLARDGRLDVAEHAASGKLTTWILVPKNDSTTLDFKCSCETFRRTGLVRRPGATQAEKVICYGVASVFTPAQNRGKGYARFMMQLLHWVLAPRASLPNFPAHWGTPPEHGILGDAKFSALYSDIGSVFYRLAGPDEASEGWVVRDPYSTIWTVPSEPAEGNENISAHFLSEEECSAIWIRDAELIKSDLEKINSSKPVFTFLPDKGVSAFQVRRTAFFIPGQSYDMPEHWGVSLKPKSKNSSDLSDETAALTFATWTLDVRPPPSTLLVTRIRATLDEFPDLLKFIFLAARKSGMERVEIWNLPKHLESSVSSLGGETALRDEHLNAFKWYGPEESAEVEWAFNEKFPWC